jgi:hypothetical protein
VDTVETFHLVFEWLCYEVFHFFGSCPGISGYYTGVIRLNIGQLFFAGVVPGEYAPDKDNDEHEVRQEMSLNKESYEFFQCVHISVDTVVGISCRGDIY